MTAKTTRTLDLRADVVAVIDAITAEDPARGELVAEAEATHLVISSYLEYAKARGTAASVASLVDVRLLYEMEAGYEAGSGDNERAAALTLVAKSLA